MSDSKLNDGCWDCECEHDYIHAKFRTMQCNVCGTHCDDQPDSHVEEVMRLPASFWKTAQESMESPDTCPFCHAEDGADVDNDDCGTCHTCGKEWKVERRFVGYSYVDGDTGSQRSVTDDSDERVHVLRKALLDIAGTSANENSDPECMADALGEIQGIVRRALDSIEVKP